MARMASEEDPFGGLFGDPEELRRRMAEFAEQLQGAQRVAWADNAIRLAVEMTVAGLNRLNLQGNAEQQSQELLQAMRLIFPEAVILVRETSEGEPRQLLNIRRQLDDWHAALAFARSLEEVDAERVGLWGSSFSGGHVV